MAGRRSLLALARARRALLRRADEFSDPLDHELALEVLEAEARAVAGPHAAGRSGAEILEAALVPQRYRPRPRTPLEAALLEVLDRLTGFRGQESDLGVTTGQLAAALRRRGYTVAEETIRRRALALARRGEVAAVKRRYTVPQPVPPDHIGPPPFGGAGRCLRREWRFAVPTADRRAGIALS